jgi:hypothetical protein
MVTRVRNTVGFVAALLIAFGVNHANAATSVGVCETHLWSGATVNLDADPGAWNQERIELFRNDASGKWTARYLQMNLSTYEYQEHSRWRTELAPRGMDGLEGLVLRGQSNLTLSRALGWIDVNHKPRSRRVWLGTLDQGATSGNSDVRFVCTFFDDRLGLFAFDLPDHAALLAGLGLTITPIASGLTEPETCRSITARDAEQTFKSRLSSALQHLDPSGAARRLKELHSADFERERVRYLGNGAVRICEIGTPGLDFLVMTAASPTESATGGYRFTIFPVE